jgi:CRISPR-associated exonuclease Cas4
VFAYEEPELFLHPHAQRVLADALETIAGTPEHQILVCTHSTYFVDLENYRSIVIVHRPDPHIGTKVKQCTADLFAGEDNRERKKRFRMASWINPDRGELFFARKVILVEGETEKVVLPFLAKKLGCYDRTVSLVDCGSKHNLALYIDILNAFSIEYVVVHDEDPVPDPPPADWGPEKIREKRRTHALNGEIGGHVRTNLGRIEVVSPEFDRFCGVSASQGEKKGKPLAALDHFSALAVGDIPTAVTDLVRRVFAGP